MTASLPEQRYLSLQASPRADPNANERALFGTGPAAFAFGSDVTAPEPRGRFPVRPRRKRSRAENE